MISFHQEKHIIGAVKYPMYISVSYSVVPGVRNTLAAWFNVIVTIAIYFITSLFNGFLSIFLPLLPYLSLNLISLTF